MAVVVTGAVVAAIWLSRGDNQTAASTSTSTSAGSSSTEPTTTTSSTTVAETTTTLATTTTAETTTTTEATPATLPSGSPSADCVNGWITPEPWSDLSRTPYHRLRAFYGLDDDDIFVTEVMRYFHGYSPAFHSDMEFWFIAGWLQADPGFRGHWLVIRYLPPGWDTPDVEPLLFAPYEPSTSPAGASWITFWSTGPEPGSTVWPGLPGTYPGGGRPVWEAGDVPLFDPTIAGCIPAEWLPLLEP